MARDSEELTLLLRESRELLQAIYNKNFSTTYRPAVVSPIAQEIAQNVTIALNTIKNSTQDTDLRFELINKAINAGYWDLIITEQDPLNPNNPIKWGDACLKMLGFGDESEFPGILDSWWSRIHPDDKAKVLQAFTAHVQDYSGRTPYDVEYRERLKTGEYRWFRSIGTTIRNETGVPLRTVGVINDIHGRKIKEQKIEFLLTRFELINLALTEGPWDRIVIAGEPLDPQNKIWWSPQFRKLLGYQDEHDFPNVLHSWSDRLHPEDKERTLKAFAGHINDYSGKTPFAIDYRLCLKNGEYRWFHATGTTVRDKQGVPLRIAGTIRDIEYEKRKEQYEEQIVIMNNQLNTTLETISEGIIVTDLNEEITQINKQAIEMIKAKKDEQIVGRKISNIFNCGNYFKDIMSSKKKIDDKEMMFNMPKGLLNCIISVTPFEGAQDDTTNGLVITLKEIQSVRRLINRMTGSQARFVFESIIGRSEKIIEAIKLAKIAANSFSNVLLFGDSGTGKEMFAQAIHNQSERCDGPFIAINCGALPRGLIESELFGYEGGAFTGSRKEGHPGKFELANDGTIFLDEIGDMPLEVQVSLLRVLQNKEVLRVGGNKATRIDVRIIAATNKNLDLAIKNHTFREDLYYRLNVFSIKVPALRERVEDIELLTEHFINKYNQYLRKGIKGCSEEVRQALLNYRWPGNIRELENVIERAINIATESYILIDDLPSHMANYDLGLINTADSIIEPVDIKTLELKTIMRIMERNQGNIRKSAMELGIGRSTLYRKLREAGLDSAIYRSVIK